MRLHGPYDNSIMLDWRGAATAVRRPVYEGQLKAPLWQDHYTP
jgi:hypothetical protein